MAISPDRQTKARLESLFPLLVKTRYAVRGEPSRQYNCIAWALGFTTQWWWPDVDSYWPTKSPLETVEEFISVFRVQGFEQCSDAAFEYGYDKIALYVLKGEPTHAARIETDQIWTSKLGRLELIEHSPEGLNGDEYGVPVYFFRKKR